MRPQHNLLPEAGRTGHRTEDRCQTCGHSGVMEDDDMWVGLDISD